jgi:hypothetical protein
MTKQSAVAQAVEEAWAEWLHDHPISVPETIEAAVEKAFGKWLDTNEDVLLDKIAKKVGNELQRRAKGSE